MGSTRRRLCPWMTFLRFSILAALTLAPTSARAQFLFRQVNLSYLTRRADVIVQGRVVGVRYEPLPGYDHIPTVRVTLEVDRMLRGPGTRQYTFRQMMPFLHPRGGKQGYAFGQELMLFLPLPSQYGLSSPLAHEQGTFHISRDPRGRVLVSNEFNNSGLFRNVSSDAEQEGAPLPETQLQLTQTATGPVELERFVSLVKSLAVLPRIK